MDTMAWRYTPPISPQDQVLTSIAQFPTAAPTGKADWPYAVGSFDFTLYDNSRKTLSAPSSGTVGVTAAWGPQGQYYNVDDDDDVLGPLERLQRKWGIGDRKTRGK
jgi:hypothetical protein